MSCMWQQQLWEGREMGTICFSYKQRNYNLIWLGKATLNSPNEHLNPGTGNMWKQEFFIKGCLGSLKDFSLGNRGGNLG